VIEFHDRYLCSWAEKMRHPGSLAAVVILEVLTVTESAPGTVGSDRIALVVANLYA
jgi:hypothetical protein